MSPPAIPCRLCGAPSDHAFSAQVLGRHQVGYFRCRGCFSLQTEPPWWLDEAYADGNLADIDTGSVVRALDSQAVIATLARFLRLPPGAKLLDIGGGSGLLCRLLRDTGFDARVSDLHAPNTLARGFDDDGGTPAIASAFEVAEHLADPATGMAAILGRGATACVLSTDTYTGQGADWWYINATTGQHVFFYSRRAMHLLAARHGYTYAGVGNWHFFLPRPFGRLAGALFWRLVAPSGRRWVRAWLAWRLTFAHATADRRRALERHLDA